MSKPSGTSDELLKLPSGGGSVSGSGSFFNVDLNTGTATARFDLFLPTGPNGIKPPLSLTYSAGSGDGPFGLGWSFGFLTIRRNISPSTKAPDPTAVGYFSLDGVGDLVDMGSGRYRPTVDTTGQLIEFASAAWMITDSQDNSSTLGTTANAQLGGDPPVAWLLDSSTDTSGNAVRYTWIADSGARLPGTITWGTYQIVFQYQQRPDLLATGQYGAAITISKRCSSIELHVVTETNTLVRSWGLLYEDKAGHGRSLLATIREQGHAADGTILCAPDRTFTYSELGPATLLPVTGWTTSLLDNDTDLVDLNGDGLPDILRLGAGLPAIHSNLGGGRFGPPQVLSRAPAPLRLSSANVAFANMSGEGNVDLLVLGRTLGGYYPLSVPPGGSGPSQFGRPVVFTQAPRISPGDTHVRLLDLNGDGITDVLIDTGRAWIMYFRESIDTWSASPLVLSPDRTPPVSLTDPHVYLADMTGDGLTDIVRITGGGVTYWPARADGGWGAAFTMSPSPAFARNHDPRRLALIDIDGDGCADLVYVGPSTVTYWRNVGAGQLASPVIIPNTPPAQPGSYRIVDLLGIGTAGVHFELPMRQFGRSRQVFLDLSGNSKPYLLTDLTNGPFASTRVTYRTSTEYATDDASAGSPWQTYHPFSIQCVARTDQTDHGTGLTASVQYIYHDGRYDPKPRMFLGFGRVESNQVGDETCPTLRVETVFHLGLDPDDPSRPLSGDEAIKLGALRRRMLRTTVSGFGSSRPFSDTLHTYDTHLVPSGLSNGAQVAVPYVNTSTEQRWEQQKTMVSTRTLQYLAVNEEGDVTLQRTQAQRSGSMTPDQDITTSITLATGGKNLRLPARINQRGPDGTVISGSVNYYDGPAFEGLPEGQATAGLLTRTENLAFDNGFVTSIWGASPPDLTAYGYHRLAGDTTGWWITRRSHQRTAGPKGPLLSTKGPLGGLQQLQLDAAGQRAIAVTDAVGNTVTATINARVWQTESITDANGQTTTDQFDALGRVTATIGPLDSASSPGATFSYLTGPVSLVTATSRVTHGGSDGVAAITWIDGSGRALGKGTPGPTTGQWIISKAVSRNVRGLVTAAYAPYLVNGAGWQAPPGGTSAATYRYDELGRVIQSTRFAGLTVTTRREGDTLILSETWPGNTAVDIERQVSDAAGQLISVSRNAGDHWVEQTYRYAPSGKLTTATLPGGAQIVFTLDLLGRRFSNQSPDAGRTVSLIDASGNERLRTNSTGQTVRTEFDASNRMISVFHDNEANPRIKYDYLDTGGPTPVNGITANRVARLWRITDEIGTIVFQYDQLGQTISTQRTVAATGQVFLNQATYDALGRTVSVTLPAASGGTTGRSVLYGYGPDGRLVSASGIVKQASYDLFGRMTSIIYANGATTRIDYRQNVGGIARLRVLDPSGASLRDSTVALTQGQIQGVGSAVAGEDGVSFLYDGLRRLTAANYVQGTTASDSHSWSYDDTFLITTCSDSGALTYKPGTHQLASVSGAATVFDAAGRLTTGRSGTLVFDAADHLASVKLPSGEQISHSYDYRGQRSSSLKGAVRTYLRPTENVEIQSGSAVVWISFGGTRVAADVGGVLWFIHPNALGGMDLLTDPTGHFAYRARQTPYGVSRPPSTALTGSLAVVAMLLTGADEAGLICQGARWYDPVVGQFLSPDPMIPGAFILGAWSPYLYGLGNPVALRDPSGCSFLSVLEEIGIALLAAASVVGAVFTGGATLVAFSVIGAATGWSIAGVSGTLLVGVAVGSLGGALVGELSAQKEGGNLWAGAFVGALAGGAASIGAGTLGFAAFSGVGSIFGAHAFLSYVAFGVVQGTFLGAGTGVAIGYAGGKGTPESVLIALVKGAVAGAALGAVYGGGLKPLADFLGAWIAYWIVSGVVEKLGYHAVSQLDTNSVSDTADVASAQSGLELSSRQVTAPNSLTLRNVLSFRPNSTTTSEAPMGTRAIPLTWIAPAVLSDAGFASAIDASMAADQAGFSYAQLLSLLIGAASYFIDHATGAGAADAAGGGLQDAVEPSLEAPG
jgi:RHS repeat-associated protein